MRSTRRALSPSSASPAAATAEVTINNTRMTIRLHWLMVCSASRIESENYGNLVPCDSEEARSLHACFSTVVLPIGEAGLAQTLGRDFRATPWSELCHLLVIWSEIPLATA